MNWMHVGTWQWSYSISYSVVVCSIDTLLLLFIFIFPVILLSWASLSSLYFLISSLPSLIHPILILPLLFFILHLAFFYCFIFIFFFFSSYLFTPSLPWSYVTYRRDIPMVYWGSPLHSKCSFLCSLLKFPVLHHLVLSTQGPQLCPCTLHIIILAHLHHPTHLLYSCTSLIHLLHMGPQPNSLVKVNLKKELCFL